LENLISNSLLAVNKIPGYEILDMKNNQTDIKIRASKHMSRHFTEF